MLTGLRALVKWAYRGAAKHRLQLVASLCEVRISRRRGFARLKVACNWTPPPPPGPPSPLDYVYVPSRPAKAAASRLIGKEVFQENRLFLW